MKIKIPFTKNIKKIIDNISEVRPIWGPSPIETPLDKRIPKIIKTKMSTYAKHFKGVLTESK